MALLLMYRSQSACGRNYSVNDSPTLLRARSRTRVWVKGMLKLLERSIKAVEQRLVLLAPPQATLPTLFDNVTADAGQRAQLIRQMQSVRGAIYLHEGNVKPEQLSDGRHQTPEDEKSWHLLMTDGAGNVSSCAWYLEHENARSINDLRIRNCPLAEDEEWRERLESAVASELRRARRAKLRYAEVGGWAVSQAKRCSSEGLVLALAAYGLSRMLGGALGITTANVTHSSSSILRRLGGSYLEFNKTPMPAYFDVRYDTRIELLRFDSRKPAEKYLDLIDGLSARLASVAVVADPASVQDQTGPIDISYPGDIVPIYAA